MFKTVILINCKPPRVHYTQILNAFQGLTLSRSNARADSESATAGRSGGGHPQAQHAQQARRRKAPLWLGILMIPLLCCFTAFLILGSVAVALVGAVLVLALYAGAFLFACVPIVLLFFGLLAFLLKVAQTDFVRYKAPLCWSLHELVTVVGFLSQVIVLHRPQLERTQVWPQLCLCLRPLTCP